MASLRFEQSKGRQGWRLQFRDVNKRNRTVWLGSTSECQAREIAEHVQHLLSRIRAGRPPEPATTVGLERISDELRDKLAKAGLCQSVCKLQAHDMTIEKWASQYIDERSDVKESTRSTYRKARANLVDFFGKKRRLAEVTAADAKRWRIWLKTHGNRRDKNRKEMAEDTVRKRTAIVKQFFWGSGRAGLYQHKPVSKDPKLVPR